MKGNACCDLKVQAPSPPADWVCPAAAGAASPYSASMPDDVTALHRVRINQAEARRQNRFACSTGQLCATSGRDSSLVGNSPVPRWRGSRPRARPAAPPAAARQRASGCSPGCG